MSCLVVHSCLQFVQPGDFVSQSAEFSILLTDKTLDSSVSDLEISKAADNLRLTGVDPFGFEENVSNDRLDFYSCSARQLGSQFSEQSSISLAVRLISP